MGTGILWASRYIRHKCRFRFKDLLCLLPVVHTVSSNSQAEIIKLAELATCTKTTCVSR